MKKSCCTTGVEAVAGPKGSKIGADGAVADAAMGALLPKGSKTGAAAGAGVVVGPNGSKTGEENELFEAAGGALENTVSPSKSISGEATEAVVDGFPAAVVPALFLILTFNLPPVATFGAAAVLPFDAEDL